MNRPKRVMWNWKKAGACVQGMSRAKSMNTGRSVGCPVGTNSRRSIYLEGAKNEHIFEAERRGDNVNFFNLPHEKDSL